MDQFIQRHDRVVDVLEKIRIKNTKKKFPKLYAFTDAEGADIRTNIDADVRADLGVSVGTWFRCYNKRWQVRGSIVVGIIVGFFCWNKSLWRRRWNECHRRTVRHVDRFKGIYETISCIKIITFFTQVMKKLIILIHMFDKIQV